MFSSVLQRVIDLSIVANDQVEEQEERFKSLDLFDMKRVSAPQLPGMLALREYLRSQPIATILGLVTIMYAGRGDFPITQWKIQYDYVRDTFAPAHGIQKLIEFIPHLRKYLGTGMGYFAAANIDVDSLLDETV